MKKGRIGSIIQYVREHPGVSSSEIITGLGLDISPATIRRDLTLLVAEKQTLSRGAE